MFRSMEGILQTVYLSLYQFLASFQKSVHHVIYAKTVSHSLQVNNPRGGELLEIAWTHIEHSSSVRAQVTGSAVLLPRNKAAEQLHGSPIGGLSRLLAPMAVVVP